MGFQKPKHEDGMIMQWRKKGKNNGRQKLKEEQHEFH